MFNKLSCVAQGVLFFIPVTGHKFPVTRNQFPVTGRKFPVTGRNILERAMNKYWRQNSANGKWHIISRRGELGLNKSKVLQRLRKQKSKLALMDK